MKKLLKDYLLPNENNQERPQIFGMLSVAVLSLVIVAVFAGTVFKATQLRQDNDFLAAVLPAVVTTLTNNDRVAYNLPTLRQSAVLERAAQLKANDMAAKSYFAHTSPEGLTPWYWFGQVGYSYEHAGENLAVNFSESEDVVNAWMRSEGHRANILSRNYTEIGIATARGIYKGKEVVFVVQMFGKPLGGSTASTAEIALSNSNKPIETELKAPPESLVLSETIASPEEKEEEKKEELKPVPPRQVIARTQTDPETPKKETPPVRIDRAEEKQPTDTPTRFGQEGLLQENRSSTESELLPLENETVAEEELETEDLLETDTGTEEEMEAVDMSGLGGESGLSQGLSGVSSLDWLFFNHSTQVMRIAYSLIIGLIFASLIFTIYRGVRREHMMSIVIGSLLVILMLFLLYLAQDYLTDIFRF